MLLAQEASSEGYEAGRGLITLEGPSGMFINPTSATLPQRGATLQYCFFLPNNETDVVGHGLMGAYGITDELEVGLFGNLVDFDAISKQRAAFGPLVRYRLTKDEAAIPQTSIGYYGRYGDTVLNKSALFAAAYKRFGIDEDGVFRSLGMHGGVKNLWLDSSLENDTTFSAYGGLELQFPLRIYAVGEIQTKDSDVNTEVPYSFGLQWRAANIAMSIAAIQNGNVDDPSFYFGIGGAI